MISNKVNEYFKGICDIMSEQIDLVYDYNDHKDVEGCADDFPFFGLYVHLKKNLYETLLNDLYLQGKDLSVYLNELNNLPEFIEMGVEIKATPDGLVFPHIAKFAANKQSRKYVFYKFELFPYNRYVLGLEYILFKFAPLMIEGLYADFETMDNEWTAKTYELKNSWIAEYWADKFGHFRSELQKQCGPLSVLVDENNEVVYKTRGEDLDFTCPNENFAYIGYFDDIEFSEEDMVDEYGDVCESVDQIPWSVKWKRFVEQVDYYYYCCYRRYPANEDDHDLNTNDNVYNLWDINTSKTFGSCLVRNMGAENEDVVDLIVSVPFLGENLIRAYHDVKSCSFDLKYRREKEGCNAALHINPPYKKAIKEKQKELLEKGYSIVVDNPDYPWRTNDGIDYYGLTALDQEKQFWTGKNCPDWYNGGKPNFYDKNHYLKHILYAQWDDDYTVENMEVQEALVAGLPIVFAGKPQLLETYRVFVVCVLCNLRDELKKGTFSSFQVIEDILRKTYFGMHKLYVSQAIALKTNRADAPISKAKLQEKLGVGSATTWTAMTHYYDYNPKTQTGIFKAQQLENASHLIGYSILGRIEE